MNRFVQDPDAVPATYNPMRELVDENLLFHSRRLGIVELHHVPAKGLRLKQVRCGI